jgi:ABC-type antimicrobial peptide transport system permease subunit
MEDKGFLPLAHNCSRLRADLRREHMSRILSITNSTKAAAALFVNSVFALLIGLDVMSGVTAALIIAVVNAAGGLFLRLTYDLSAKRIPDTAVEP